MTFQVKSGIQCLFKSEVEFNEFLSPVRTMIAHMIAYTFHIWAK